MAETPMQPGWTALLWFVAVIAAIPLLLWLLKRSPLVAGGSQRAGTPRTVAMLPLSAQHKVVTVEVGQGEDRLWLVLGISPQGIRTLHTMAPQGDAPPAPPPPAAAFAQLLSRLRVPRGGAGGRAGDNQDAR
ncbi:MAG: flagellar biosynthetic protein FliO [Rubrivivax sp.]|nr:flagellar biosynthetic protein FliO [Rubrivivax sp.]